jgi:hypothetical protein
MWWGLLKMNNPSTLGLNALEHIRYLVQKIGPRPAGSASEKRGLDYAAEQLIRFGYQPEWITVPFGQPSRLYLQNLLAGGVVIMAGWLWHSIPLFAILTPLLLLIIAELERLEIKIRPKKQTSHNVVAINDGAADNPLVIFCAHIDSAPAMAVDHPLFIRLFANGMGILQRVAFLVALLSMAAVLGFAIPGAVFWPVAVASCLVGGWFMLVDLINQLDRRKGYSPGAVDNASGVGMVLALAEAFAENKPKRLQMGFLITGAEEPGLYGAEAFASQLLSHKGKSIVFNIDMVGAGDKIHVVTRVGSLFSKDTTRALNDLLFEIDPQAKPVWYSLKSGDFEPILRAGLEAVSIQTAGGSVQAETAYHTCKDTFDLIDIRALDLAGELILEFIEILPYSDWALEVAGLQI